MSTIIALETHDVRFPTSRELDGSDAMNPDPDYSAAYVVLRTDGAEEPECTWVHADSEHRPRPPGGCAVVLIAALTDLRCKRMSHCSASVSPALCVRTLTPTPLPRGEGLKRTASLTFFQPIFLFPFPSPGLP